MNTRRTGRIAPHAVLPAALVLLVASAGMARAATVRIDTTRPPGATFKRHSVVPLPVVFYSPETRVGGGAALMHAYRTSSAGRPIATAASLIYTQNRQVMLGVGTDAYLAEARYHVIGGVGYSKFPNTFYGIGNATPASDSESYSPRAFTIDLAGERLVVPGVYLGIGGDFASGRMIETEPGRSLASGTIRGSDVGQVAGLGAAVTYDTRDNTIAAAAGTYARLSTRRYAAFVGSEFDFSSIQLDLRRYRTVGSGHVLAVQALWMGTSGDVPFHRLPQLGGQSLLRGYFQGRYRDRQYVAAQAEYRTPSWHRLGLAAFAGAGEVAPGLGSLTLDGIHAAAGAGLRVLLNRQERLALRLDYGAGGGNSGFYITVAEAF